MRRARRKRDRIFFGAKDECRARKDSRQSRADTGVEVAAFFAGVVIEVQRPLDVRCRDWPPESAAGNGRKDLRRARSFFRGGRGLAYEQSFARFRFADAGDVKWTLDVAGAQ